MARRVSWINEPPYGKDAAEKKPWIGRARRDFTTRAKELRPDREYHYTEVAALLPPRDVLVPDLVALGIVPRVVVQPSVEAPSSFGGSYTRPERQPYVQLHQRAGHTISEAG